MILCLDVGNTQMYGGAYDGEKLLFTFRKKGVEGLSSDELALFLGNILREQNLDPKSITAVGFCSVVPQVIHSLKNAVRKYLNIEPITLGPGMKTGLKIKYKNPIEVGADRIANAMGANILFPKKNKILVDLGTATTFCLVNSDNDYLGGAIAPGPRISMEVLEEKTAMLPSVEIIQPLNCLGQTTIESIQSGIYFSQLGLIKELTNRYKNEVFDGDAIVIGTGGFSSMFREEVIFDEIVPDLVLKGLLSFISKNL